MTADIHDDKSRKRDWDGIIALAILVTTPITLPIVDRTWDAMIEHQRERMRAEIVGQCIDLSPLPQGQAVDLVKDGEQVKILQTDKSGNQHVTFMDFRAARALKTTCK